MLPGPHEASQRCRKPRYGRAIERTPLDRAPVERLSATLPGFMATPEHLSVLTTKYWRTKGVKLTVGFLDGVSTALAKKILQHMNAWAKTANVTFVQSAADPQVRIARVGGADGGYWSFIGTDILHITKDKPTMNLQEFSEKTPESEFHRVVRHETGHTLGFPHEHMRRELVALIDPDAAIKFYGATQGWTAEEVRQQVLTPIEDSALWGTTHSDPKSIMCYQIPGSLTKNGKPIVGGTDIDSVDYDFAAKVYPKTRASAKPKK